MPFRDVVGHRPLLRVIARAVREGSLPPSTIFAGPDGVGKRLVAGSLAQVLNCEATVQASADTDGLVVDACGACAACRRIERGLFADVLAVNPGETGSITIEPVRAAIDQAAYRPFEGRWRVVIIDEADRLVPPAQNALLKNARRARDAVSVCTGELASRRAVADGALSVPAAPFRPPCGVRRRRRAGEPTWL